MNPESGPSFVAAYIDNLLIFSVSLQEHLDHLRLREVGLKVNLASVNLLEEKWNTWDM